MSPCVTQKGDYVRKWLPELRNVPASAVHEPWRMTPADREHMGCTDYPRPIPGTRYTGGTCVALVRCAVLRGLFCTSWHS